MRKHIIAIALVAILGLAGCSKSAAPAGNPQATVQLHDGSSFSGAVTASSPSSITLQAPNGESRTYPMSQVASVQYADQSAAAAAPAASGTAAPAPSAAAPAPPPPQEIVRTIPAGTSIQVRNNEPISSQTAQDGQTFSAVVEADILDSNGQVVVPRGSTATLVVRNVVAQGKVEGRSELSVDVGSVTVNGKVYRLETSDVERQGREGVGMNKRTGTFAGGGAALGGIMGALAGGGKGAAIGALSGAGAGTAAQAATRGKGTVIPAETLLSFQLEAPVHIRQIQ